MSIIVPNNIQSLNMPYYFKLACAISPEILLNHDNEVSSRCGISLDLKSQLDNKDETTDTFYKATVTFYYSDGDKYYSVFFDSIVDFGNNKTSFVNITKIKLFYKKDLILSLKKAGSKTQNGDTIFDIDPPENQPLGQKPSQQFILQDATNKGGKSKKSRKNRRKSKKSRKNRRKSIYRH